MLQKERYRNEDCVGFVTQFRFWDAEIFEEKFKSYQYAIDVLEGICEIPIALFKIKLKTTTNG